MLNLALQILDLAQALNQVLPAPDQPLDVQVLRLEHEDLLLLHPPVPETRLEVVLALKLDRPPDLKQERLQIRPAPSLEQVLNLNQVVLELVLDQEQAPNLVKLIIQALSPNGNFQQDIRQPALLGLVLELVLALNQALVPVRASVPVQDSALGLAQV